MVQTARRRPPDPEVEAPHEGDSSPVTRVPMVMMSSMGPVCVSLADSASHSDAPGVCQCSACHGAERRFEFF